MGSGVLGRLTACVVLLSAFGGVTRAERPPLLWAADASGGAPYVFQGTDHPDRVVGFEVDLKEALEKEIGRPIQFKQYDFKSLVPGLQRGDFDFAMNGLEVLPVYQEQVLFSRPYYVYKLQISVPKTGTHYTSIDAMKAARAASALLPAPQPSVC